jgi:hypothetical protein
LWLFENIDKVAIMGCIASCNCCAGSNQVELTEQQVQLRVPPDESAEDADRYRRVRQWVMSIEEVPKDVEMAAMQEYLTTSCTDCDGKKQSPVQNSEAATATQGLLDSDTFTPTSDVQCPRSHMKGIGYETICYGSSFEESNF